MKTTIIITLMVLMLTACQTHPTYPIRPEPADTVAQVDSATVEPDSLAILTERVEQLEKHQPNIAQRLLIGIVVAATAVLVLIPMIASGGN